MTKPQKEKAHRSFDALLSLQENDSAMRRFTISAEQQKNAFGDTFTPESRKNVCFGYGIFACSKVVYSTKKGNAFGVAFCNFFVK